MAKLQLQVVSILDKRYPNYSKLPNGERVLLAMSVLANDIKVREIGGNNRGRFIKEILASTGTAEGSPWCAASIEFCFQVADVRIGPNKSNAAAVLEWLEWAKESNRLRTEPSRGRLCIRVKQLKRASRKVVQERHIGIVADIESSSGKVISYEGNTSSGGKGSQNDGGGLYRRIRSCSYWSAFIDLDDPAT